jgi:O-antigen/teichoic acid export membrane protein
MSDNNQKTIARNTLLLYFRMFVTMVVSLFTSRVILDSLGASDYGIYNVVGGFVMMFGIVKVGLVSATNRFIAYDLGKGDIKELNKTFSSCVIIYLFLSLLAVFMAEIIGPWFINTKLNIPPERLYAAQWVFQISLITLVVGLISSPYNSLIIAHEKMKAFAYISIYEVIAKLVISYIIYIVPYDKLISYVILYCIIQCTIPLLYWIYCRLLFVEARVQWKIDKNRIKNIYSFTGWSMLGGLANMGITQGLNVIIGMFFSPVVNAARGIAVQVQSAITQFSSNFQLAVDPQIIKSYAKGDIDYMTSLIFSSSRYSYYLLYIITLPVMFETDMILNTWLVEVPEYTSIFFRLIIITTILDAVTNPAVKAIQATGKIKRYQLSVNTVLLTIVPVGYFCLLFGLPPYSVFIAQVIISILAFSIRFRMIKRLIKIPFSKFVHNCFIPIFKVTIASGIIPLLICVFFQDSFIRLLIVTIICFVTIGLSIYYLGLFKSERELITSRIAIIYNKIKQ